MNEYLVIKASRLYILLGVYILAGIIVGIIIGRLT